MSSATVLACAMPGFSTTTARTLPLFRAPSALPGTCEYISLCPGHLSSAQDRATCTPARRTASRIPALRRATNASARARCSSRMTLASTASWTHTVRGTAKSTPVRDTVRAPIVARAFPTACAMVALKSKQVRESHTAFLARATKTYITHSIACSRRYHGTRKP